MEITAIKIYPRSKLAYADIDGKTTIKIDYSKIRVIGGKLIKTR